MKLNVVRQIVYGLVALLVLLAVAPVPVAIAKSPVVKSSIIGRPGHGREPVPGHGPSEPPCPWDPCELNNHQSDPTVPLPEIPIDKLNGRLLGGYVGCCCWCCC